MIEDDCLFLAKHRLSINPFNHILSLVVIANIIYFASLVNNVVVGWRVNFQQTSDV